MRQKSARLTRIIVSGARAPLESTDCKHVRNLPVTAEAEPLRRRAAVFAADAVGFSRLMHADERATLATLDACRGVFRAAIARHGGRLVDMAGDSVLAVFEAPLPAVRAAEEAQRELAVHNAALPAARRLWYRVGVHADDILEKADGTVYGDGVNVAARLQAMATPGGVNVSGPVFEVVREVLAGPFVALGEHVLKNIAAPIAVYRIEGLGAGVDADPGPRAAAVKLRPAVRVLPLTVISGGAAAESLAAGLHADILNGLARQTAVDVTGAASPAKAPAVAADFELRGSVRGTGDRVRLSFALTDLATQREVWTERYDRPLTDVFDLEDDIARAVASTVRLRIKADAFAKLRDSPNARLTDQELLSKAAGYFVHSVGHNDEVTEILGLVLAHAPDNAMAHAMWTFCRHRAFELSPLALPGDAVADLIAHSERALALDPDGYFAHLVAAFVQQDVLGDFSAAAVHAETAFGLNPGFSTALAMVGIVKIHQGEVAEGLRLVGNGLDASPEDPHRFRNLRELALGELLSGAPVRAAQTLDRLLRQAPALLRNELVAAAVFQIAGRTREARRLVETLRERAPVLSMTTLRPTFFGDAEVRAAFEQALRDAGIPA